MQLSAEQLSTSINDLMDAADIDAKDQVIPRVQELVRKHNASRANVPASERHFMEDVLLLQQTGWRYDLQTDAWFKSGLRHDDGPAFPRALAVKAQENLDNQVVEEEQAMAHVATTDQPAEAPKKKAVRKRRKQ